MRINKIQIYGSFKGEALKAQIIGIVMNTIKINTEIIFKDFSFFELIAINGKKQINKAPI